MRSILLIATCALVALAIFSIDVAGRPRIRLDDRFEDLTNPELALEEMTALQQYVNTPDSNYKWTRLPQFDEVGWGYKIQWMNLTSQRWLTDADVNPSIWWHFVAFIIPDNLDPQFASNGLMYITGGKQDPTPPKITSEDLIVGAALAQMTGTVTIVLFQIPNQPTKFTSEQPTPRGRSEDAMLAWAWKEFLLHPDRPEWLPRLPMTKASLRAMDAATEYWQQQSGNVMSKWIVAGASKRGWTTWTVGACDPKRVIGIIPLVLDELNFVKNIHHHWRAYGGWSFALKDYVAANITTSLDSPNFAKAMSIVDPIAYADILTMPKLICSTAGDEFLLPDNVYYYWDLLQGESHFHSFPNLEHSMAEDVPLVLNTVAGFVMAVQSERPRPEYVWKILEDGTIHVEINANNPPSSVTLWSALTIDGNERRDFRLVTLNQTSNEPMLHLVLWKSEDLSPISSNSSVIVYEALKEEPAEGWIGFTVELVFPGVGNTTFRVSSAPSILPQTFPYPDCYAETCSGQMV